MIEEKKEQEIKFITCPKCQGSGRVNNSLCSNCRGLGFGAFWQNYFFYFNYSLNYSVIVLNKLKKTIDFFLDLFSYIFAGIGLMSLIWWLYKSSETILNISDLFFWQERSWSLLVFWLSVVVDLFIIYRVSEKKDARKKIKDNLYTKNKHNLPNTWKELARSKQKINILTGFDEQVLETLSQAYSLSKKFKHGPIQVLHIFSGLLVSSKEISALFSRLNIDQEVLVNKLGGQLNKLSQIVQATVFSQEAKEVLIRAYIQALQGHFQKVGPIDLVHPCYLVDKKIAEVLYDLEITDKEIENTVAWFKINERIILNYQLYKEMARFKPSNTMDRAYTALATPLLNTFSYDLTLAAKYGRLDLCIGREKEVADIFSSLESGNNGLLIIGPTGVGKATLIGEIARRMVTEQVPKVLRDKRLLELDLAQMIGGASPAEAQERMLVVVNEIARAKNIILYIKDIENAMGISSGEEGSLEMSEILANALERKQILAFSSLTNQNYRKYVEGTALDKNSDKVLVEEPEENQAIQMAESKIAFLEHKYKIYFSYRAIAQAIKLSDKYMHEKYLPAKAIEILEKVAAKVFARGENSIASKDDVAKVISEETNIPVTKVGEKEGQELLHLEDRIHERLVNQTKAVDVVAAALRRARVQLRSEKRPIANFLFLGPTGVGKTELAKTISEVYFGKEEYMIRVDMSEYQQADSVKKMIGSAQGVKGYLTEAVRKAPFSLILLDEIEKAHPDILNLFLQVMDDGRLTDGQGRTIDFTNSIIIATSNIGALFIQEEVKKKAPLETIRQQLIDNYLSQKMRPELINRFDGIVVFQPLTIEQVAQIAKLMLKGVAKMLDQKGISLEITEGGALALAKQGYQPEFGARPLRRLIQDKIENQIANKLLGKEIKRRDIVKINDRAELEVVKAKPL